jgi:hypothetical protein
VYDTIFVYDTIWTHETIYDTVWVYDTIFIDEIKERIEKLTSIEVSTIDIKPMEKYLHLVPPTLLVVAPIIKSNRLNQPIKPSHYLKSRNSSHPQSNTSYQRLTLNPAKGEFDPTVFLKGKFSLEGYSGTVFQNTRYVYSSEDAINQSITDTITGLTGLEYGLRLNYQVYQFAIQSSIGMSQLKERFKYVEMNNKIDSTQQSELRTHWIRLTDSVRMLNVDRLLEGDSVWTTYIYQYDSLITYDSIYYLRDTTKIGTPKNEIITHYLLEIPLILSWQWEFPKTAIQLKMGGINQFYLFSKSATLLDNKAIGDIENVTNFTKYNIALYGGISYSYDLSKQFGIGIDAYYKYPLMKFGTGFNTSLYKQTYGFNFSFRYRFKNQL